jgi:hypothetical protein
MQIGPYGDLTPLPGRPGFFFGRETRFESRETILVKASGQVPTGAASIAFAKEAKLLQVSRLPHVRLSSYGHDPKTEAYYYGMVVPARFALLSLEGLKDEERKQVILAVAIAVEELNGRRVAYRNFVPAAFGQLGTAVLPFDFSRAGVFRDDRLSHLDSPLEDFDPPEAEAREYDVIRGEVYGLGCFIKGARPRDPRLDTIAERMTSSNTRDRPQSVAEVIEELRLL